MAVRLNLKPFQRKAGLIRLLLALAAALLFFAGQSAAEPYMAVREGYKCSKCHVNHTGGGKRTAYAQVYMQTRMAANNPAPQPEQDEPVQQEFFNGMLNEYFSVGADLRTSYNMVSPFEGENTHQFNRPSGCASCHQATGGGGKLAEVYFQMEPVPGKASLVISQNLNPTVESREMYGLIEGLPLSGYFKAGIFRLPTGLQNTYDDPFAHGQGRLNYGFNGFVGIESVRGTGVEFGIEPGPFAVAFSVTNSPDTAGVPRDDRYALMGYAVGSLGMIGFNYSDDPLTQTTVRTTMSAYGGISMGRLTGLIHFDRAVTEDADEEAENPKLTRRTGLGELDVLVAKGRNLKFQYEYMDPELDTGADLVDRFSIIYEPFATPYFQYRVGYRDYTGPEGDASSNFNTYFVEAHFLF